MRSSFLATLMIMAVCPFLGGCMITQSMWAEAGSTVVEHPCAVGVVTANGPGSAVSGLVVRYWPDAGHPEDQLIPFDDQGRPREPFRYDGPDVGSLAIAKSLAADHRAALKRVSLKPFPVEDRGVHPPLTYVAFDELKVSSNITNSQYGNADVSVLWVRIGADSQPLPRPVDPPMPDGTLTVLMPAKTPRRSPAGPRVLRAALLTPLTLAADAIVTPVTMVVLMARWSSVRE